MNSTPINELRAFLLAVSQHGNQHLAEVDADLKQTKFLLNEAIEKLGASFAYVHELVNAQQMLINKQTELSKEDQAEMQRYKDEMNNEINVIVTSMQFQDMTNQLLQKTIKQVNGLTALLNTLSAHGHDIPAEQEHEDIVNFLTTAQASLNQSNEEITGGLRNSVDQQDMTSGDVDLF